MEFVSFSLDIYLLLFILGILAGIIDTLAGVGGLIALPALLLTGINPIQALATNKIQSIMGTGTATLMMLRYKKIKLKSLFPIMIYAFFGSFIGTIIIQFINNDSLEFIVPIVIFFILLFFLFSKSFENIKSKPRISEKLYSIFIAPIIGVYDGMFGPGTGIFYTSTGISLRGFDLIKSTANAKALNFSTNAGAVIVFLYFGKVIFSLGLSMILGQFIGARIGSKLLININPKLLRLIVIISCCLMLLRYLQII